MARLLGKFYSLFSSTCLLLIMWTQAIILIIADVPELRNYFLVNPIDLDHLRLLFLIHPLIFLLGVTGLFYVYDRFFRNR